MIYIWDFPTALSMRTRGLPEAIRAAKRPSGEQEEAASITEDRGDDGLPSRGDSKVGMQLK